MIKTDQLNLVELTAVYVLFAPLMVILLVVERTTGKRSPYWPFERGHE